MKYEGSGYAAGYLVDKRGAGHDRVLDQRLEEKGQFRALRSSTPCSQASVDLSVKKVRIW